LLERLFQNIINNAAKYTSDNGMVIISTKLENRDLIISFFNSGTTIPEGQRIIIFDKYTIGGDIRPVYSKGLGLYFCKLIMNAHGGRIWVDCTSEGNTFHLSFNKSMVYNAS
jgi:two-component system sensor histidine kinase KdpD